MDILPLSLDELRDKWNAQADRIRTLAGTS